MQRTVVCSTQLPVASRIKGSPGGYGRRYCPLVGKTHRHVSAITKLPGLHSAVVCQGTGKEGDLESTIQKESLNVS